MLPEEALSIYEVVVGEVAKVVVGVRSEGMGVGGGSRQRGAETE
jgi:hypothetical protein